MSALREAAQHAKAWLSQHLRPSRPEQDHDLLPLPETAEIVQWHDECKSLPPEGRLVLMWIVYPHHQNAGELQLGLWDGDQWRDATIGVSVDGVCRVYWAEISGPGPGGIE